MIVGDSVRDYIRDSLLDWFIRQTSRAGGMDYILRFRTVHTQIYSCVYLQPLLLHLAVTGCYLDSWMEAAAILY